MPGPLSAVPWAFAGSGAVRVWTWSTPHFVATITEHVNRYSWVVEDLVVNPGNPRTVGDGVCATFTAAEDQVRASVGKSYPRDLGYRRFAGPLATTFQDSQGVEVDFGVWEGRRVVVTVATARGSERRYAGTLRVEHFDVLVESASGSAVRISPAHVLSVASVEGGRVGHDHGYTGVGRVYRGTTGGGCSGVAGFVAGTVDHFGEACRIHEDPTPLGH